MSSIVETEKRDYWPEEEPAERTELVGQIVCVQQNPVDRCGLELFVSTGGPLVRIRVSKKKLANLMALGIEAIATE